MNYRAFCYSPVILYARELNNKLDHVIRMVYIFVVIRGKYRKDNPSKVVYLNLVFPGKYGNNFKFCRSIRSEREIPFAAS